MGIDNLAGPKTQDSPTEDKHMLKSFPVIPLKFLIIRDNNGNPIIKIGEYQIAEPTIDGKIKPYGGHWISRAEPELEGEGFFCNADDLVKLLNDFYDKEF